MNKKSLHASLAFALGLLVTHAYAADNATRLAYSPMPAKTFGRDVNLRSDKAAGLRSDAIPSMSIAAGDFANLAPAAGGRNSMRRDSDLSSDGRTGLRADKASLR